MVPSGKNDIKFLKFGACIRSPEHFLQNLSKTTEKITKIAIFQYFQKWFVPSGPDFYAIFKMGLKFSVPLKLTKLLSNL